MIESRRSRLSQPSLGTDATIAQHITTICDRRYAERDANQRFHPTKLGIALVEGYNSMGYRLNLPGKFLYHRKILVHFY
jgi:DNA topoisomerase-3